jgi:hypothetical protein
VNQVAKELFRAKAYANKHAEGGLGGKPNKLNVSGDIETFRKLAKDDSAVVEAFKATLAEALKK